MGTDPHDSSKASSLRTKLLAEGEEPDARFSLANERTFLAWIRTALALLAAGIGIEAFTTHVFETPIRQILASILLVLGAFMAISAAIRWVRVERSMRTGRPLPLPLWGPLVAGVCAVTAVLVMLAVVTG
ncbi:YidH family protein [Auritidibacter ignavus]|uniref:YidH family protein n=1 Tax=Auritidibacter ignavus TaxID=678932 RepID=UPI00109CF87E|nr:DUF202 domain-containing protein [Auritidibacter ignavus]